METKEKAVKKLTLAQKISKIQFEAREIKKSGKNTSQGGYNYKTFTDIKRSIQDSMLKYEMFIIFNGVANSDEQDGFKVEKIGNMTQISYLGTFTYGDNEETKTITFPVLGMNTDIAKAHGSAITYALKYVFNLLFLIPDETLDPDHDNQNQVKTAMSAPAIKPEPKKEHKRSLSDLKEIFDKDNGQELKACEYFKCSPDDLWEYIENATNQDKLWIINTFLK